MTIAAIRATGTAGARPDSRAAGAPAGAPAARATPLAARYLATRAQTEKLCEPLQVEDYVVSSMPDVSPAKWHLAHTSWFFETFLLAPHEPGYTSPDPRYAFLFNSYYVQAGERHCRAQRGLVTRPTVEEVFAYRAHVDEAVLRLCDRIAGDAEHPAWGIIELGIHHEQQHQELLVTDIKHVFWMNPMRPAYQARSRSIQAPIAMGWHDVAEGVRVVGRDPGRGDDGFAFDNESPSHRVFLEPFRLATRLVTNEEYLAFIEDGGYRRPELWLSNGWATVQENTWKAPLYWERADDGWREFTLAGDGPVEPAAPACHLSYYEADAFARWAGARLPTEPEWEVAARAFPVDGTFAEAGAFHPAPADAAGGRAGSAPGSAPGAADTDAAVTQLYGDAWQWTQTGYTAYPGYVPAAGAIGEYNGKWMCDQWVLRGASCATPRSHARVTYRNFFPSDARWQFTGVRLAAGA